MQKLSTCMHEPFSSNRPPGGGTTCRLEEEASPPPPPKPPQTMSEDALLDGFLESREWKTDKY